MSRVRVLEPVHVAEGQVGKVHAHERTRAAIAHARRKILRHDEPGGARSERVLVTAEERGSSRLGNRVQNSDAVRRITEAPDAEHETDRKSTRLNSSPRT